MLTIDLPKRLAPALTPDGYCIRSALDWQKEDGGKGKGKVAAQQHAADSDFSAVLWKSGNVTVYANDRSENSVVCIRYTNGHAI